MRKIDSSIDKFDSSNQPHIHPQDQKKSQGEGEMEPSKKTLLLALGSVIALFKKELLSLSNKPKARPKTSEKRKILEHLVLFRRMLDRITKTDQSYNPEFIRKMSKMWHSIIQEYYFLQTLGAKDSFKSSKMDELIDKMNSYPEKEEHSFGYYLTEYVGEKWLPFPFMECLQKIYEDHQASPSGSYLQSLIDLLNEILASPESK